ncbi:autophagy protein 5 [Coniophora puteana RWD-64-598 SS2]|uniref:Autophagy protein 5 n=1 Tax=Coniophora puteana (strain RWD-64-598) TaxID=741705 RepID=A0A5M3MTT0_CONPW|nr:autophagy protein 5 [Coniophora puteana RWD-64-598 SS2]EIW82563.1 autophagy protein 5 [Coniophora puteana RWD-64-598 SS2]
MSAYGSTRHMPASSFTPSSSTPAATTLFRRLSWEGTVPLEIRVAPQELPANSDRGLECYYIQAPRVSYLPLLVPEIKRFLMDIVFDEMGGRAVKEEDWWFEGEEGALLKWHWPIGLIYDNYTISSTIRPAAPSSSLPNTLAVQPLRLTLHLTSPPTDKLLMAPSAEACKQAFMGQLKEADFLRWGNTKRMTGLRKAEQDGMWEGIREHNFDDYWRIASKVVPSTVPSSTVPQSTLNQPGHTRPPSADGGERDRGDKDGAYNVRSIPVRLYLPDGPVMQDLCPPVLDDGSAHTLGYCLFTHLPLLFPNSTEQSSPNGISPNLAYALVQGVHTPLDAEMAWLGACMAGADGWVCICIGIKS